MQQDAAAAGGDAAATLESAHRALLERRDLQFNLDAREVTEPPRPPDWLREFSQWLGSLFDGLGPVFEVLFWGLVALAVLALLFLIVRELGGLDWALPKRKAKPVVEAYHPQTQVAHALLADADELAAQGRFAEAVHTLLLRSIEDMRRWRPRTVRPSLTSRDIGALDGLPTTARPAFAAMAQLVETSLFGGQPVDAQDFARSRTAYAAFAFEKAWQ